MMKTEQILIKLFGEKNFNSNHRGTFFRADH